MTSPAPALGQHTLLDFFGCDPGRIAACDTVREQMLAAVRDANGTIVTDVFHQFSPHGISGVVVISESHVTVHTWPERGFVAVDVFTCGTTLDHERLEASLAAAFSPGRIDRRSVPRGVGQ